MSPGGSRKWMDGRVEHIGRIAVFYLPSKKLNAEVRGDIHDFFVSRHGAYTHESGDIRGYWHDGRRLVDDSHERYEISFKGDEKFREFLGFLSELCSRVEEKSIYLTVGEESFLVRPARRRSPRG